jgi:hypothetical protein
MIKSLIIIVLSVLLMFKYTGAVSGIFEACAVIFFIVFGFELYYCIKDWNKEGGS